MGSRGTGTSVLKRTCVSRGLAGPESFGSAGKTWAGMGPAVDSNGSGSAEPRLKRPVGQAHMQPNRQALAVGLPALNLGRQT